VAVVEHGEGCRVAEPDEGYRVLVRVGRVAPLPRRAPILVNGVEKPRRRGGCLRFVRSGLEPLANRSVGEIRPA